MDGQIQSVPRETLHITVRTRVKLIVAAVLLVVTNSILALGELKADYSWPSGLDVAISILHLFFIVGCVIYVRAMHYVWGVLAAAIVVVGIFRPETFSDASLYGGKFAFVAALGSAWLLLVDADIRAHRRALVEFGQRRQKSLRLQESQPEASPSV